MDRDKRFVKDDGNFLLDSTTETGTEERNLGSGLETIEVVELSMMMRTAILVVLVALVATGARASEDPTTSLPGVKDLSE